MTEAAQPKAQEPEKEEKRKKGSAGLISGYFGMLFKINKTWSADCRYTFSYFFQHDNGGLDNFAGHAFTMGASARF